MVAGIDDRGMVSAIARAVREGRSSEAVELLERYASGLDSDAPPLSTLHASRSALTVGANDVALHLALHCLHATGGRRDAVLSVADALEAAPAHRDIATRMRHRQASAADWGTAAAADRLGCWPALSAVGPGGVHEAALLEELAGVGAAAALRQGDVEAWRVDDARVTWTGRSWAVGASDGQRHRLVLDISDNNPGGALRWSEDRPRRSDGSVALVVNRWTFRNYFHWLVDGLHDVVALDEVGALDDADRVVVCVEGAVPTYVLASLTALGYDRAHFELTCEPFDVAGVSVAKPVRSTISSGDLGNRLRRMLGLVDGARERPRRRLLLSRRDATKRRVVNEDELERALGDLGFETVVPGAEPFDEQVSMFADAEAIVGPHGAGMGNMLFSPPGAVVVELLVEAAVPYAIADLATSLGHRHAGPLCLAGGPLIHSTIY